MNKLTVVVLLFLSVAAFAQDKEEMRVERGTAVNRESPIRNVFIDAENNKWVGNTEGLYQVHSINHSTTIGESSQFSVLRYRSGNYNLTLPRTELEKYIDDLNGENEISAAHYDTKRKELWVGTTQSGLYRFKLEPQLQLVKQFTQSNSVFNSNYIKNILIEPNGRYWIGTEEGMVWGQLGKWKLKEKYVSMEGVAAFGGEVWVLGDEWMWRVSARNKWGEVELDPERFKGLLTDIAVDSRGRVWLASEIITRFDPESGRVEPFAGPEEFTSQYASAIAVDQDDALWVGTRDKGLFLIEKEDALTVSCLVEKEVSCDAFEPDGALKVVVVGGIPPYSYQWSGNLSGEQPKGLGPGEYQVTVTDSDGRQNTGKATIQSPGLRLTIQMDQSESGPGNGDGKATVSVEGGQPNYRYRWDNGENTASATRLVEGEHRVTVVDQAGCEATAAVTIGQIIAPLAIEIKQTQASTCAGDQVAVLQVEVAGGKAPYQYQWNQATATGEQPSQLSAGTYQVTVSDSSGKNSTASFVIESPEAISAQIKVAKASTTGQENGEASVKVKGGSAPYTYLWDNGERSAKASRLGPGEHQLTVTDAAGCTTIASSAVEENILPLSVQINQAGNINCFGAATAALQVQVEGGKPPFQYQWQPTNLSGASPQGLAAGDYSLEVIDASGQRKKAKYTVKTPEALEVKVKVDAPASTGQSDGKASAKVKGGTGNYTYAWDTGEGQAQALKLGPGDHQLTVTDGAGCTTVASVNISENILNLSADLVQTAEITCNGASTAALTVEVNGGKGPYAYQWSATQLSGAEANGLGAGTYEVQVSDASGKNSTAKITIKEPEALSATTKVDTPASTGNADGKANARVSGGTGKYTYRWDNGESTKTASKLAPGDHSLTITDEAGCSTVATISISENILNLSADLVQTTNITCNGSSTAAVKVEVSGGKGPYTYQWSATQLSGAEANGLGAGTYEVQVNDVSGKSSTAKITIKEPEALSANIRIEAPASTDNADGKASARVSGGTGKYTYRWDNGETTETASKLAPGEHQISVSDEAGCQTIANATITENVLVLSVDLVQEGEVQCYGDASAKIKAEVNGGKGPFTYQWSDPSLNGEQVGNLKAGTYTLTVSDSSGKVQTAKTTIAEPPALVAQAEILAPASTDNSDGQAKVNPGGGVGPYTYQW
ncbi:MAG: hypothetical protein AAGD05_00880, partial [Bacteroidota bacterium]